MPHARASNRGGDFKLTPERAKELESRLRRLGLSPAAIRAAWPRWWREGADQSPSARLELRFALARNLGLDPRSLLQPEGEPRFVWRSQARFKHLTTEGDIERAAIASFGKAVANLLVAATPSKSQSLRDITARQLREALLRPSRPNYVQLIDLVTACWSTGVPIVYLRVFPWPRKRMAAMCVSAGNRSAILLAKDSMFPAQIAFYVAHEIGHLALGHLEPGAAVVDMDQERPTLGGEDSEEGAADAYALELLTGSRDLTVVSGTGNASGPELARVTLSASESVGIEAGTLALLFGYSSGRWPTVMSAMKRIYPEPEPVWREMNRLGLSELRLEHLTAEGRDYLTSVLGLADT